MSFDVFISHASEDKDDVARPLAEMLRSRGLRVWFDEMELKLGDSLRRSIDRGLIESRYGLVILSPNFFAKEWPRKELDALVAREDGSEKVILPIWHRVSREDILKHSPLLADKLAAPTSKGLAYLVDQVVRAVEAIQEDRAPHTVEAKSKGMDIDQLVAQFVDRLAEIDAPSSSEVTGVRTGFVDLDRCISGLQPGTLTLLGGRPRTGKTTFVFEVAQHVALVEGLPVLLCAPATSAKQTTDRLISMLCGVTVERLRAKSLTDVEWGRLPEVVERLGHSSMHICDEPSISVFDLQMEARRKVKLWGAIGAILIDSLEELAGGQASDAAEVCRELKRLARELNCPVVVTSVLSRVVESRPDTRPALSDLNEVGPIEHYLDVVLFMARVRRGVWADVDGIELIIAKQREGGPIGTIDLAFGPTGRLEISREQPSDE